jgi:hypothetical protein
MGVNYDKPQNWKEDVAKSVSLYNEWFLNFAPSTYQGERRRAMEYVEVMLNRTNQLRDLTLRELRSYPAMLPALRMSTAPPIARDRLIGLTGVPDSLVDSMEIRHLIPPRMNPIAVDANLEKIAAMIKRLTDFDVFPWLNSDRLPTKSEFYRATIIVADRLCGTNTDPIVRNAQEKRQLAKIKDWLEIRGYEDKTGNISLVSMVPGTFAFHLNVPGLKEDRSAVNIPIDVVIMPASAKLGGLPLMIEAKSAGDYANVNKRRKEEATKVNQLRRKYGTEVHFVLFLCGYFNSGYLGYSAADLIDWVWEHRIDDLAKFGL